MIRIAVRRATPADLPEVLALVDALLRELGEEGEEAGSLPLEALAAQIASLGERHVTFVATDAGARIVGVLTLATSFAIYAAGEYGVINEMYVVPDERCARVGALLIAAAAAHGRARGWRRIDVTAPESERWRRTHVFYERNGFVFTGPKLKLAL